jgi:hypothetical protein
VVVALVLLVGAAGCSSAKHTDTAPPVTSNGDTTSTTDVSTTAATSSSVMTDSPDEQAAQVTNTVKAYNAAYRESLRNPGSPPDLSRYATGAALQTAQQDPQRFVAQHLALRARAKSQNRDSVYDVHVDGTKATATDCEVNDDLVVNSVSGQVVSDKVQTNQSAYTLELAGGTWKITQIQGSPSTTWEGVSGCAVSH